MLENTKHMQASTSQLRAFLHYTFKKQSHIFTIVTFNKQDQLKNHKCDVG